jgi:hypothetical protein
MDDFGMIKIKPNQNEVELYPAIGKVKGDYSKQYWDKRGE